MLIVMMACGGLEEDGEGANSAVAAAPTDVSDPRFLPHGLYKATVTSASCNVNTRLHPFTRDDVFIARNGSGANLPLPLLTRPGEAQGGYPRQDFDLTESSRSSTTSKGIWCPEGEIHQVLSVTELTPTRLALSYRQERQGCSGDEPPSCTIDFAFTLAVAACAAPDDPLCEPTVAFDLGGIKQRVECTCNTK